MKTSVLVISPSRKTRGGITAVVQAYESNQFWKRWNCEWIETHIDLSVAWKLLYFGMALIRYFLKLPFSSIVHVHISEPMNAFRKSFFLLSAVAFRKPVILHFHSFSPETSIESRWKPFYRVLFKHSTKIIVLSPTWERSVLHAFGPLPITVIPNPCPVVVKPIYLGHSDNPFILFAGSIICRKGYSELLKAFAAIANQFPQWQLVFAGNGELDKAQFLARELGVESRVHFPGWVLGSAKDSLFRKATIFCLPSFAEGFPMAILDAFAYGLPVLTTPVGGVPDILVDGVSASFVPCGDVDSLASALTKLMESPELRIRYSEKVKELAGQRLSLEKVCQKVDALYRDCLAKK
jgi:glycosyltransferase involved in cell wall biosynthesis